MVWVGGVYSKKIISTDFLVSGRCCLGSSGSYKWRCVGMGTMRCIWPLIYFFFGLGKRNHDLTPVLHYFYNDFVYFFIRRVNVNSYLFHQKAAHKVLNAISRRVLRALFLARETPLHTRPGFRFPPSFSTESIVSPMTSRPRRRPRPFNDALGIKTSLSTPHLLLTQSRGESLAAENPRTGR